MNSDSIYSLRFNALENKFNKELLPETSFDLTWDELLVYFNTPNIRNDKDGAAFNLCLFNSPKCVKKNVVEIHAMILDYDSGQVTIDDIKTKFKDYQHFGYTSFSHLKDGVTHKFRVIIPLKIPCPVEEWELRNKSFIEFAGGYYETDDKELKPVVDGSTFAMSRIFYLPACPEERKHLFQFWTNEGQFLDWTAFEEEVKPKVIKPIQKLTGQFLSGDELNTTITLANNQSGTVLEIYQQLGEGYPRQLPE